MKRSNDAGWVRSKMPIATDPGQVQCAVDIDPQRPLATVNYRIAKEIYSIVSSARASNTGD